MEKSYLEKDCGVGGSPVKERVVVSEPGAAIYVVRLELTDRVKKQLTVDLDELPGLRKV